MKRLLKSIKTYKGYTSRENLIRACMLKDTASVLSASPTHLINISLETTSAFPAEWKIAKIIPIHKSGSYSSFDNYRPISILPTLSKDKVTEKLIHRHLLVISSSRNFENKLISKFQFGFRPKLSTELGVTLLLDDIRKSVDEGKQLSVLFL